jgi:hypothetical protein
VSGVTGTLLKLLFAAFVLVSLFDFGGSTKARAGWKEEWEKTVESARQEGRVVMYIQAGEERFYEFEKKYGIKIVSAFEGAEGAVSAPEF